MLTRSYSAFNTKLLYSMFPLTDAHDADSPAVLLSACIISFKPLHIFSHDIFIFFLKSDVLLREDVSIFVIGAANATTLHVNTIAARLKKKTC